VLVVDERIRIPLREFRFSYARSSGPGGQHVQKVSTKATLRWDVTHTASLPEDVRARFVARFHRRIGADGRLVITSQRFRDQGRNTADCIEKLRAMLVEVAAPPRPRRKTRPGRRAVERRLDEKRARGRIKRQRGRPARPNEGD
jgi:ribosome-associated protein